MERPRLTPTERFHRSFVRKTLDDPRLDRLMRGLQKHVGARWITASISNLLHVHGLEHVLPYRDRAVILVSNHRSFFDMYVINAVLYRRAGFDQRLLFPVRANFFYDTTAGLAVNGIMSFFSMYPPVFRDRPALNLESWRELAHALSRGRRSAGIHPEGTRNMGEDPYALLPVHSGIGRLVHLTEAPVLPAFINGLVNSIPDQIVRNIRRQGPPVHLVFGPALELEDLRKSPGRGRTYRAIADRIRDELLQLGSVERSLREGGTPDG